jgi:hypothetical protein
MTGPPKSLLSERFAPRLQIERGVCLLGNSRSPIVVPPQIRLRLRASQGWCLEERESTGHPEPVPTQLVRLRRMCADRLRSGYSSVDLPALTWPSTRAPHSTGKCGVPAQSAGLCTSLYRSRDQFDCTEPRLPYSSANGER